jgi:hypothetical protein
MTTEYDPEYVENLEKVAVKMVHALQLSQQLLTKKGQVSPGIVKSDIDRSVNDYFQLKNDHCND